MPSVPLGVGLRIYINMDKTHAAALGDSIAFHISSDGSMLVG